MDSHTVIASGKAGRVWDIEGREYVDFLLGSGPMLVGHAHPEVDAAAQEQMALGTTFFANNEHGIRLAAEPSSTPCPAPTRCASPAAAPRPTSTPCAWPAPSAAATRS